MIREWLARRTAVSVRRRVDIEVRDVAVTVDPPRLELDIEACLTPVDSSASEGDP